jgi:hypothetical protein
MNVYKLEWNFGIGIGDWEERRFVPEGNCMYSKIGIVSFSLPSLICPQAPS